MSNNMTQTTNQNQLEQSVIEKLDFTVSDIETSSQFFKPKPDKVYMIKIDPHNEIVPKENDKFKDTKGNPIKRYGFKITHVNTGREQLWDTSKTVCLQIIEQLKRGFTALKVVRTGADRSTTYQIEGVQ